MAIDANGNWTPDQGTMAADYPADKPASDWSLSDIVNSVTQNVGEHALPWLGIDAGNDGGTSYGTFQGGWGNVSGDAPQAQANDQPGSAQQFLNTVTGGIGKAWDKNPMDLIKLGLGAVGGAYKDEEVKRAVALKRQQELDDRAAFNASVTGLRGARKGIIQSALKRMDGSPVFDANGKQITKG